MRTLHFVAILVVSMWLSCLNGCNGGGSGSSLNSDLPANTKRSDIPLQGGPLTAFGEFPVTPGTSSSFENFEVPIPAGATMVHVVVINHGTVVAQDLQVYLGVPDNVYYPSDYQRGPLAAPTAGGGWNSTLISEDITLFVAFPKLTIAVYLPQQVSTVFDIFVTFNVVTADAQEPNETPATARNIDNVPSASTDLEQFPRLSITPGDVDYFAVEVPFSGSTLDLEIVYAIGLADLRAEIVAPDGVTRISADPATIMESTQYSNFEPPPVTGLAAGTYFVKVYGATGADAANYVMFVTVDV